MAAILTSTIPWLLLSNLCFTITWFMECLAHQLQIAPSSSKGASSWPYLKQSSLSGRPRPDVWPHTGLAGQLNQLMILGVICQSRSLCHAPDITVCLETLNHGQFWLNIKLKCAIILVYLLVQYPIKILQGLYIITYYDKCSFILAEILVFAKMGPHI